MSSILILLSVGVLVSVWMTSGTVPVMIYYGMKVLTPGLFLPVAAGAVCTGAFFGDKVSSLSDSPVITATVCGRASVTH